MLTLDREIGTVDGTAEVHAGVLPPICGGSRRRGEARLTALAECPGMVQPFVEVRTPPGELRWTGSTRQASSTLRTPWARPALSVDGQRGGSRAAGQSASRLASRRHERRPSCQTPVLRPAVRQRAVRQRRADHAPRLVRHSSSIDARTRPSRPNPNPSRPTSRPRRQQRPVC